MVMTGGVSPESEQAQIVADEVVATLVAGTLANDGELRGGRTAVGRLWATPPKSR